MKKNYISPAACALLLALAACSPRLDWREIQSSNTQYSVLMPAKPSTFAREVNLDGRRATMTMTAAEVDGVTYAVGDAALPDAAAAQLALIAMRTAMVKNIGGAVRRQQVGTLAHGSGAAQRQLAVTEIEALGTGAANTPPRLMHARFIARDAHVVQLVVTGPDNAVKPEAVETFFRSFKFN